MKKKITRKNFDELKKLNLLFDKDASRVKGGAIYVDYDGNIIGRVGDSNDLRFTENRDIRYLNNRGQDFGHYFGSSEISDETRIAFVRKFTNCYNIGLYSSYSQNQDWMAQLNQENGYIEFSRDNPFWYNIYNVLSTIGHENYHYNNHFNGEGYTPAALYMIEAYTVTYQMNQSYFAYATSEYQERFKNNLLENLRNAGYSNNQKWNYCGIQQK